MLKTKTKKVAYGQSQAFHIPTKLFKDSAFPFTEKDLKDLIMEIRGQEIVIRKSIKR